MNARVRAFLKEEDGVTALEYGILAAVIAGVLVLTFKKGLGEVFDEIVVALKAAVTDAST